MKKLSRTLLAKTVFVSIACGVPAFAQNNLGSNNNLSLEGNLTSGPNNSNSTNSGNSGSTNAGNNFGGNNSNLMNNSSSSGATNSGNGGFNNTGGLNSGSTSNPFFNNAKPANAAGGAGTNIPPPPQNAFGNATTSPAPAANSSNFPPAPVNNSASQAPANTAQAPIVATEKNLQDAIHDPEKENVEEKISDDMRRNILNDLNRYCLEYCSILGINVFSQEVFDTGSASLGFETVTQSASGTRKFKVKSVRATILVDSRFGSANIEKLQQLFNKLDERYPYKVDFTWSRVAFPDTGNTAKSEAEVRSDFATQVKNQLERIVTEFCPNECKVHTVDVSVSRATVDEVQNGTASRYLFARDGRGALYVRGVTAKVSLDSQMEPARKQRIANLMREHLLPFGAVTLQVREMPFPRAYEEIEKDLNEERKDPFGLAKLDRILKMIKEHGSTREIIKEKETNNSESSASSSESNLSKESLSESNSQKTANEVNNSSSENSSTSELNKEGQTFWTQRNIIIVSAAALALLLAAAIGLRFVVTGKRMQAVIHEGMQGANGAAGGAQAGGVVLAGVGTPVLAAGSVVGSAASSAQREEFQRQIEIQELRDELIQIFVVSPKAAQDVFGRMLRDDGIELSSKYVAIFGEMIVFELLGDADLKKEISTLAEYIHVNLPKVTDDEKLDLLKQLKLRLTASKMRLLSSRTLDVFDFLKSKSARQIYELIVDESTRCQGIVLTQLGTEKRREIFELFDGNLKVDLLRELSSGDLVPREFLINVAEALRRKALSRPNFDGENVRGTDVLLDLLERAQLQEQRDLMADLDQTNPEASRLLRSRLVTVETLPFLRDGLLIEIFINMEPQAMAAFLAGTREHIRRLIFSKAPADLASGWAEAMDSMRAIDPDAYRLAEMQVISKIRGLASSGLINLLEVNTSLYPKADGMLDSGDPQTRRAFKISKPIVA